MLRILLFSVLASALIAQQPSTDSSLKAPPVVVKRVPPPGVLPADAVPSPAKYPFEQLINELQADPPALPSTSAAPLPLSPSNPAVDVPRDFKPIKDVPLPDSAKEALAVGHAWLAEKQAPAPGKDGRVLYTYGAGLPTMVCAPLRVCVFEMEAGEKLVGEPQIGDSVRWIISPATSGRADFETSMIVVKPRQPGLDTNLLVTTDRRAYYLRLISKPDEYLARIAFAYPEEEVIKWKVQLAKDDQQRKEERERSAHPTIEPAEDFYFEYTIRGGDENMRPVRVFDDGRKTFIQMTANAAHRELPVLVVIDSDGPEMVNYRVKGDMYIADRLFERGALILGVGKKARRVEILRGTYHAEKHSKGDPYAKAVEGGKP
jgi:type IV secretion system protein VirB9